MNAFTPYQTWWTAGEIADASLPDLPGSKRGVQALIKRQHWTTKEGCVRRRKERGGGYEFHVSLFPQRARDHLSRQTLRAATDEPQKDRTELWSAYEALPAKAREKAEARADAVRAVLEMERLGAKRGYAVDRVSAAREIGARSLWGWMKRAAGVRIDDLAPTLAGQHKAAPRKVERAECADEVWEVFKADILTLSNAPLTDAYERTKIVADEKGWAMPSLSTMRRLVKERIPRAVFVLARQGEAALELLHPPMTRDRSALTALEGVNADYHKMDVWVEWTEGEAPIRPQVCAVQDIYSGKLIAWRITDNPNAATTLLTLGDMIADWGIPDIAVFDNGREFAAKSITGGAEHRYRFKMLDNEPLGVLPSLDVKVHFTTPYRGQAKPIERYFREVASTIAKDPRFVGAYTGKSATDKPENYGARAIPRDEFVEVLAEGIAKLNARQGRRAAVCGGRSYDATFAASYAEAKVRKATKEQQRLWLLGAKNLRAHTKSGAIKFMGNTYWTDWMPEFAGRPVIIRFDPEDLHSGVHVYDDQNAYLGHAACHEPVGFFDMEGGRIARRAQRNWRKAQKEMLDAERKLSPAEHAALLNAAGGKAPTPIEAKVIAPAFGRGDRKAAMAQTPTAAPAPLSPEMEAQRAALVAKMEDARAKQAAPKTNPDAQFERCLSIRAAEKAGEDVAPEALAWAASYEGSAEYRSRLAMRGVFAGFYGETEEAN